MRLGNASCFPVFTPRYAPENARDKRKCKIGVSTRRYDAIDESHLQQTLYARVMMSCMQLWAAWNHVLHTITRHHNDSKSSEVFKTAEVRCPHEQLIICRRFTSLDTPLTTNLHALCRYTNFAFPFVPGVFRSISGSENGKHEALPNLIYQKWAFLSVFLVLIFFPSR